MLNKKDKKFIADLMQEGLNSRSYLLGSELSGICNQLMDSPSVVSPRMLLSLSGELSELAKDALRYQAIKNKI